MMPSHLKRSRQLFSVLLVLCLLLGFVPVAAVSTSSSFSDVPADAWFAKAVEQVSTAGVMQGTSPTSFAPNVHMTRGMFVTALARLAAGEMSGKTAAFSDVDAKSSFSPCIAWAVEHGIASGYPDGSFRPDEPLTRAQAAVMTANLLSYKGYTKGTAESAASLYTEGTSLAPWAQTAIAMLTRLGLMQGNANGSFAPEKSLSRAESAKLLANLMSSLKEDEAVRARAKSLCAEMTTDEKIGQVLLVNFRSWKTAGQTQASGMTVLNSEVSSIIQQYHLGNIILFGENTPTTEGTARLTTALQEAAKAGGDLPLLIGIDQEGGIVTRLAQGTCLPGNMALGATNKPSYAREAGSLLGSELAALGIHCDFAPDADVNDNPSNPVIGLRSFGSDPSKVSAMATSLLSGLTEQGIIGCAKHFPGHGNTATDTHTGLALVSKTKTQWKDTDAVPFQGMIASGVEMIMSAHIQNPNLDNTQVTSKSSSESILLPASLSRAVLTDLLRGELGFDGVICTDAMDMQAITKHFGETEAAVMALNAGADLLCNPTNLTSLAEVSKLEALYTSIRSALSNGTLSQARLDDAVTRVLQLKIKRGILDKTHLPADKQVEKALGVVGSDAHRKTERKLAEAAVTQYGNAQAISLNAGETVLFAVPYENEGNSVRFAVNRLMREGSIPDITLKIACYNKADVLSKELAEEIASANHVIILSERYGSTMNNPSHWQNAMPQSILAAVGTAKAPSAAVISIGLPYDALDYPNVPVYLAYGYIGMTADDANSGIMTTKYGPNIVAGVGAALGAFQPSGTLPVTFTPSHN